MTDDVKFIFKIIKNHYECGNFWDCMQCPLLEKTDINGIHKFECAAVNMPKTDAKAFIKVKVLQYLFKEVGPDKTKALILEELV